MMKMILPAMLLLMVIFYSCDKEDLADVKEQVIPTKVYAKIGEGEFKADLFTDARLGKVKKGDQDLTGFFITAIAKDLLGSSGADSAIMQISLFGSTAKTYKLNPPTSIWDTAVAGDFAVTYKTKVNAKEWKDIYTAKEGTITISSIDEANMTISGTFAFDLFKLDYENLTRIDSLTVTSGEIKELKYKVADE